METIFCGEADAEYYFKRGRREIDFLLLDDGAVLPVEIKLKASGSDLLHFASVMRREGFKVGLMLTYDQF